jgi:hypothetical protein
MFFSDVFHNNNNNFIFQFKTCDSLVNFSSLFDFLQLVEHKKKITCENKITAFLLVTCQALRAFTSL